MAVPDFQTLMLPVLKTAQSEISVKDAVDKITDQLNLSEEERSVRLPSGQTTRVSSNIRWAMTYLYQAGLLSRPKRAYLVISPIGKKVLDSNPSKIDAKFLHQFDAFKDFIGRKKTVKNDNNKVENEHVDSDDSPEELINDAYKLIEQSTRDEILDFIVKSEPVLFEKVIINLFTAMGYGMRGKATHVGKTGDGGIDGIIDEDALGLEKIYLQAKRYASENKIAIDAIRSFAGSLDERGARKGIFVTTSSFVGSAYDYAERSPKSIVLIDGSELTRLMYEYDVGVRTVDTIKIKKPDIDYFEDL